MIDIQNIVRAIAAHAKWKYYLRQAIATGESEWSVAAVQADDACDFGRWLRSMPPEDRAGEHWRTVKQRHREFHHTAARVLDLALARRQTDAEAAIALGSPFAEASKQLTLAMMAWKKDVERQAAV